METRRCENCQKKFTVTNRPKKRFCSWICYRKASIRRMNQKVRERKIALGWKPRKNRMFGWGEWRHKVMGEDQIRAVRQRYMEGEGFTSISKSLGHATTGPVYGAVKDLVRMANLNERACLDCRRMFLPNRRSQIFCSRKCFKAAFYSRKKYGA